MIEESPEQYIKEESFGVIDCVFYNFQIECEFENARILAWPEMHVEPGHSEEALSATRRGDFITSNEIIEDRSRYLEITFVDVFALNLRQESWSSSDWDYPLVPKLSIDPNRLRAYPMLRVENSKWKDQTCPVWDRHLMGEIFHWKLVSMTNCVDLLARSAKGGWRKGI